MYVQLQKSSPRWGFLLYTKVGQVKSKFSQVNLFVKSSPMEESQSSRVELSPTADGQWEVQFYDLPYPNSAPALAKHMYNQLHDVVVDAQIKQCEGRLLTMIDSWGSDDRTSKARKDVIREILKEIRGNMDTDLVMLMAHLDDWIDWFKDNHDVAPATNRGSSIDPLNSFKEVGNLD